MKPKYFINKEERYSYIIEKAKENNMKFQTAITNFNKRSNENLKDFLMFCLTNKEYEILKRAKKISSYQRKQYKKNE